MRTKYSIYNVLTGMFYQVMMIIMQLIPRRIFIDILGLGMQGVNGTLTNIVSMLSLAELGIGTAIICNLYKPIAENNQDSIVSLLQVYSKIYKIIAAIVVALGACIAPFLPVLFKNNDLKLSQTYLTVVFFLFIADVVVSYLFAYKRSIIIADQRNYIINIVTTVTATLMNIVQVVILIKTHSYALFLVTRIAFKLIDNLSIAYIANKKYPFIKKKKTVPLDESVKSNIIGNTKALALHYIGNYLVTGTDVLIITKFLGTVISGAYSNYQLVTTTLRSVLGQFSTNITASMGNLLVTGDRQKLYNIFNKTFFVGFVMSNFASVSLFILFNPFIKLWIGGEGALLPMHVVIMIVINFYFVAISEPLGTLRASAGLFRPDRYLHLLLALLNLVVSVGLVVTPIGMFGVFFGTFLCLCIKEISFLPYIVYKELFSKKLWDYQKRLFTYTSVTVFSAAVSWVLAQAAAVENIYLDLIIKALICIVVPNGIAILLFRKSEEFIYFKGLVKGFANRVPFLNKK